LLRGDIARDAVHPHLRTDLRPANGTGMYAAIRPCTLDSAWVQEKE